MSATAKRTATELVVAMDLPQALSARQVIAQIEAINFGIELCGAIAHPAEKALIRVLQSQPVAMYPATFPEVVQINRLHYGSPLELMIDLPSLIEFLGDVGIIAFTALITKAFTQSSEGWKNLEEAMVLRRERKAAKRPARRASLSEGSGVKGFLEPLIQALVDELAENNQKVNTDQARAAGRRYIEYHEEEAHEAGKILKSKTITIDFE